MDTFWRTHAVNTLLTTYTDHPTHVNVWVFHVEVEEYGKYHSRVIEVWGPREEPDGDESGVWWDWTFDKLADHTTGQELTDEEYEIFAVTVRDLLPEE